VKTFEGKIYFISPKVNTETRTIRVKALVDNSGFRLKPGFFVDTTIFLEKEIVWYFRKVQFWYVKERFW